MSRYNLSVTLWPSFPHFPKFSHDSRISSIRLNSAMMNMTELDEELEKIKNLDIETPLYYDIKGRQLRIKEVIPNTDHLDIRLNHPISVDTPTPVLFKAGADWSLLHKVSEDGYRLEFLGGPKFNVKDGESLHIRDESLKVGGDQFTAIELEKIHKCLDAGFTRWFLSYVECQKDVDEFVKLVGTNAKVVLKIENKRGLEYVKTTFKKTSNISLCTARGDMYVELDRPHEILNATRLIIDKDPDAIVGSRMILSIITDPVPSCADWCELAWLADIGYKNFMLCDELCLKDEWLSIAVNVFSSFDDCYSPKRKVMLVSDHHSFSPVSVMSHPSPKLESIKPTRKSFLSNFFSRR